MSVSSEQVREALSRVSLPSGETLSSSAILSDIYVAGDRVIFSLTVPSAQAEAYEMVRTTAQKVVEAMPGVEKAIVALTGEKSAGDAPAKPVSPPVPPAAGGGPRAPRDVAGVRHIIAVASGKGGVGKSTTAVNLALALFRLGLKVGMLDADIYGPSLPRLLGLRGKPQAEGRTIIPMNAYGLRVMSMGSLVEEDTPMIWRGPMVISALTQLLREVAWGTPNDPLDVLVVDMPPGTGDAQLTMAQQVPLSGAVIVSTPQDLALIDARKGLAMFQKTSVPVFGIVENMSHFICPDCGADHPIFGHGGARAEAERIGVPFLGEVPLEMAIRAASDAGTPVVASAPDGPHASAYITIAEQIASALHEDRAEGPRIVFE